MPRIAQKDASATLRELQTLPNIGPAGARDLVLLGIGSAADLKGRTADELYDALCAKTGLSQDPCVWDTFASVIHFAETGERRKWWEFTSIRKSRAGGSL
jgi:hypothetical protein